MTSAECDALTQCPEGQIYRQSFVMCGLTCDTFQRPELCEGAVAEEGCACPEGKVMSHLVSEEISTMDFFGSFC